MKLPQVTVERVGEAWVAVPESRAGSYEVLRVARKTSVRYDLLFQGTRVRLVERNT